MKSEMENADATKRGAHAWQIAGASVLVAAFVVLLVLPGFLAAWCSNRPEASCFSEDGMVEWGWHVELANGRYYHANERVSYYLLIPSGWLMQRSQAIRLFYNWEYHRAGGKDVLTGDL
ncbi:MAG TPA: hypothetical protein VG733_15540 [Chthoniobacteraceae bacterium]|nr:hypothetical protein [Chthoniobacteraceae bacterium]